MSEKITSSTSSSLSQYKKTGRKKTISGDYQKGKVAAEVKRNFSGPESGPAGEQVNYSPPVRDDNLNISNEATHFMNGEGKDSEATLNEIMEKIFSQPAVEEKSSGKVERFFPAAEEGNDGKSDISALMEGTDKEIEIGKNAFRKLSEAGERNRKGDKTRCVSYDRPEMGKEEVYSLWSEEISAKGSASPEKEEKTPEPTSRERLHRESHNIMEKLDGRDRAEEKSETVMGGRTYKKYETSEKDVDGGKEISFKENHETAYKDKEGNVKKDTSSSVITRNPDGSYNKVYERTDGDGNKYNTELRTNPDGSSERTSRTLLNDGTRITSSETEDKEGRKKIISEETRPDGSKVYKERIVDENGKGKVVMRETKPDGRTLIGTADGSEKEKKSAGNFEKAKGGSVKAGNKSVSDKGPGFEAGIEGGESIGGDGKAKLSDNIEVSGRYEGEVNYKADQTADINYNKKDNGLEISGGTSRKLELSGRVEGEGKVKIGENIEITGDREYEAGVKVDGKSEVNYEQSDGEINFSAETEGSTDAKVGTKQKIDVNVGDRNVYENRKEDTFSITGDGELNVDYKQGKDKFDVSIEMGEGSEFVVQKESNEVSEFKPVEGIKYTEEKKEKRGIRESGDVTVEFHKDNVEVSGSGEIEAFESSEVTKKVSFGDKVSLSVESKEDFSSGGSAGGKMERKKRGDGKDDVDMGTGGNVNLKDHKSETSVNVDIGDTRIYGKDYKTSVYGGEAKDGMSVTGVEKKEDMTGGTGTGIPLKADEAEQELTVNVSGEETAGREYGIVTKDGTAKVGHETGLEGSAGGECNVEYDLDGSDGNVSFKGKISGGVGAGGYEKVYGGAKTDSGSGVDLEVKKGESKDIIPGGTAGIDISIDKKEGIHVELELGGGPLPVDIKISGDLKPEDLPGVNQTASSDKKGGRGENITDDKVQVKAGATAGVNRGEQLSGFHPESSIEGTLKPASIKEQQVKSAGGSSANIPSDLNGAYNYFDKYFPEEAEDMKEMSREGKLNILTQKEAEEILPEFGEMGRNEYGKMSEGGAMPSESGQGIISIKLRTDLSDKEIAANMRHEYWHAKFDEYSGIKQSDLEGAAGGCIRAIQETFCYTKELEAKEKMGLDTTGIGDKYKEQKDLMEQLEKYLDLRKKWEAKEIDTIPGEYESMHKLYGSLTREQKKIIDEQLEFYYKNI